MSELPDIRKVYCRECGEKIPEDSKFCSYCGKGTNPSAKATVKVELIDSDKKNRWVAVILAFWLGWFGIHKFYLGQIFSGVMFLIFFWTFIPLIFSVIDFIYLISISNSRFDELYNTPENKKNNYENWDYL